MPNAPSNYLLEQEQLKRKQAMYDNLTQSIMQQKQGQMVGNRYVGPGAVDAIGKVLQAYLVSKGEKDLQGERAKLQEDYNTNLKQGMEGYLNTRQGTPASEKPYSTEQIGNLMNNDQDLPPQEIQPAVKGDPRRAAIEAVSSAFPQLQQLGMHDLTELGKNQLTIKDLLPHATPESQGKLVQTGDISNFQGKANIKTIGDIVFDPDKKETVVLGGPRPTTYEDSRGDKYQTSPSTGVDKKLDNSTKVSVSPQISVINKGEGEFMKGIGDLGAKDVVAVKQAKVQAQRTIQSMQKLEQLDGQGVFSGPGANLSMTLGTLGEAVGMKVDRAKLQNSQAYQGELMSQLSTQLTGSLARSTTDKDMEILKAPLPELLNSRDGRAALRRQAIAKAQEHIDYADEVGRNVSKEFPEAGRLLNVLPGNVPVPQRQDVPAGGGSKPTASNW